MNDSKTLSGRVCLFWILLVGVLAHGLSLGADYYMDDGSVLTPEFLAWDGGWTEWRHRLIPGFLSALTFEIFGDSAMAQHVWNLLFHLAVSVTVFWAARVFLEAGKVFEGDPVQIRRAALLAGLLFACHPICSEAVNYARCTRIQLVTLFSLMAAIGTLRFCQRPSWRAGFGTVAVIALATFSKDPGIVHAMGNVAIVVAVFAKRDLLMRHLRRPLDWAVSILGVLFLFGVVLGGLSSWWVYQASRSFTKSGLDFGEHALTQGRLFWEYAQRVIVPVNLCSDHHVPMTRSFSDVAAVLMTAGVALLVLVVLWMVITKRLRFFGGLAMLALAPLLLRFLYPISELMVEYRVYPAMPWVALLVGVGLAFLYQKNGRVMKYATLLLFALCTLGSIKRSLVWQDVTVLAQDVIEQYPTNNRARNELQRAAYREGDYLRVFELRKEVLDGVAAVDRYNRDHAERGRRYNVHQTNSWYLQAEAKVALALAEAVGSQQALAHLDMVEQQAAAHYPEYLDEDHEHYKYMEPLADLRELIHQHGAAHDRKLAEQASTIDPNEP